MNSYYQAVIAVKMKVTDADLQAVIAGNKDWETIIAANRKVSEQMKSLGKKLQQ